MVGWKKKEKFLKKKVKSEDIPTEESQQSLRSWIRKIEQSTTSVSSRLSAVEKRLSVGMKDPGTLDGTLVGGPVETLVMNLKKKDAGEIARVLDGELALLHNEVINKDRELTELKEQYAAAETLQAATTAELKVMRTALAQMNETLDLRLQQKMQPEPFVMHLGTMEIPVEFTGIIGGLLAFTIAILVVIDQKSVLLSPVFLFGVGMLLIGFALLKMVRARSRSLLHPHFTMPLKTSSQKMKSVPCERKD